MSDDSDVMRGALRGLRRDSLRAQRRREPALMVSIGLAEPEEEGEESEERDDDWISGVEKNRDAQVRGKYRTGRPPRG